MISIKEYLEQTQPEAAEEPQAIAVGVVSTELEALLPLTVAAYRSALVEMGNCGRDACPALSEELKQGLRKLGARLGAELGREAIEQIECGVRDQLQGWGRRAALHYRQKASEVKEILLLMARTAESVGERDLRCAQQISAVTTRLKGIANLEDLTEIRESIKRARSI